MSSNSGTRRAGMGKIRGVIAHKRNKQIAFLKRQISLAKTAQGTESSLELHREAVARFPDSADLWYRYARVLLDTERPDAGLEALAQTLYRDPAHLMALEYFISLSLIAHNGRRKADVGFALDRLAMAVNRPGADTFGALDFLIPHGRTQAVRVIAEKGGTSLGTAAAKIAIALDRDDAGHEAPWAGSPVHETAYASVLLARGRYTHVVKILNAMDDAAVPAHALRRAARRALAGHRPEAAVPLLQVMQRIKPQDAWVAKQLAEFDESRELSNYMLIRRGFPLPPVSSRRRYEPIPRKVLYTLHNALPFHSAGYATRTHGLLSRLNRSGFNVQGVTRLGYPYDMPGRADMGPIESHHTVDEVVYAHLSTQPGVEQKKPLFDYVQRYADALESFAMEAKPAVIHAASNHWNGLATVIAANRLGIPSVYEVRGLWEVTRGSRNPDWVGSGMYRLIARMEADAARGATQVLTITNALKDELVRRGVEEAKISVVPNGVDTGRFTPLQKDAALASALGIEGKTVIGYIGSILDYEGLEILLEAARVLKQTRSDFHVLIVGDGAELERFRGLSVDYDLQDIVTFTGRVPHEEVEKYYSIVDIAPFPRLPLAVCEMVSPLKPFEAMAMGKAVVASNVAALSEIVQDGVTGLLHQKGDAQDLHRVLERLLDDPSLRETLAAQGLAWVRAERDWSHLATSVTNVYNKLSSD